TFTTAILGCIAFGTLRGHAQQLKFNIVGKEIVWARLRGGPVENPDRRTRLEELFRQAGCTDDRLTNQVVKSSKLPNVICMLPGGRDYTIIVGAHFDNRGAGGGIVDNWSGASLLPSLYESLSEEPRRHNFRFIGFTDEEKGLIGSAFYTKNLDKDE